jgi:hypothetical protein
MRRRRGRRDERGAVILLVSLVMTVLLIVTSFVVDLGTTRATKRDAQAIADLAALDAGYYLSGSSPNSPGVGQPREACIAGIEALQRNVAGFLAAMTDAEIKAACAGFPQSVDDCVSTEAALVAQEADPLLPVLVTPIEPVVLEDGQRTVTIRYPVRRGEIATGQFSLGGARDGLEPCERMGFDLTKTNDTMFSKIMGVGELSTGASAVVRGTTDEDDRTPPAVLLLERTDCGVFNNSASGSGNLGVQIEANGTSPGLLHADSNATTNCSTNMTQSNAYAIYGTSLSGGAPSIVVTDGAVPEDDPDAQPRRGAIRSAATNGRAAATYPGGLSVAPTVGGVVSRKIVDDKYNSAENPAIRQMHTAARNRLAVVGPPAEHVSVGCTQTALNEARAALREKIFVNCASVGTSLDFAGFTDVVFGGEIVTNNQTITFPNAATITLHGKLEVQNGSILMPAVQHLTVNGGVNVRNGGNLAVNSNSATSCGGREGPGWNRTTQMVIFGGDPALRSRSNLALCQTTVYLAGPLAPQHVAQQVVAGGSCTPTKPCPRVGTANTATGARIDLQGNGREAIWSAPNQHDSPIPLPEEDQGLEDLALWMEGAGESAIKGGAILLATGVFFAPNADFIMSSPASGLPRDAQFVSRTMVMNQGTFRVSPNPNNAIFIPTAGVYGLIR